MINTIRHTQNGIEYDFADGTSDWEKEAIREFGVTDKSEARTAIAWREALDQMDNQQYARVMRGKHPTDESKEIGRPKNPGNSPDHAGSS